MRLLFLTLAFWLSAFAAHALPRVMSLNLCADAYLMGFADKDQIVALTYLSRDAALSAHVEAARDYPTSDGQIEAIIDLKPDLVIVSAWSDPMRNALIERLGFDLLVMNAADNYQAARGEITLLGAAIGRDAEAATYLAGLDAAMAALIPLQNKPRILPLQRRNLTSGGGHILDDIIARAGAVNQGRRLSQTAMGRVSLETALAEQADYILLNERVGQPDSRGAEFIAHPALAAAYPPAKRVHIDNNLLVCAGATTPRAVATLIDRLSP